MITMDQLRQIMPHAGDKLGTYIEHLNAAMLEFGIATPKQRAAFLAQLAHESGEFRYTQEIASGHQYEGRPDLGNTEPGDGVRYKGRGLIQLTGRRNYAACGKALGLDLIAHPELLEQPREACRSAAWFWKSRHLNQLADSDSFASLTRAINGGLTGLDDRLKYWLRARKSLNV